MILINPADVVESPNWNTLIPPQPELPCDIDDSYDSKIEEDDNDNDDDDDDDDLSLVPVKSEEADHTC
jgi:hypothetical protein